MYHVEIRDFPHNTHAYNLDQARLNAVLLDAWVRGEIFELGGREWIPARSKLTILEGEELPLHMLSMGRGWNNARHRSKDVTDQLLAGAKANIKPNVLADSERADMVIRDILARVAMGPLSLATVWDRAEIAAPEASSGEWLVLAQGALQKLTSEGRVALCRGDGADSPAIEAGEVEEVLRTRDAWSTDRATGLFVRAS
jgi:hypothetical protein